MTDFRKVIFGVFVLHDRDRRSASSQNSPSWEPPTVHWRDSIATTGECTDTANSDARGRYRVYISASVLPQHCILRRIASPPSPCSLSVPRATRRPTSRHASSTPSTSRQSTTGPATRRLPIASPGTSWSVHATPRAHSSHVPFRPPLELDQRALALRTTSSQHPKAAVQRPEHGPSRFRRAVARLARSPGVPRGRPSRARRAIPGGPPRQGERGDVRLGADAGREHVPDEVDVYRLAGVCRRRQVDGRRDHAVQLVSRRLRQDSRRLCDADRVCPRPPARPPRVPRAADGVLPGEQRGVRDAVSAAGARRRRQAGRHHRL